MTSVHQDRDEIKARADIRALAEEFGFKPGRYGKNLHCGFHPDKTPSASVRGQRIRCFGACDRSWDVFELVQQAHGVDFQCALRWLADRYGVTLGSPLSDSERRAYSRQRAAADREALELLEWRNGLLAVLREHRNTFLSAYHRCKSHVLHHGFEGPLGNLAADAGESYCVAYQRLDRDIERIENAPWGALLEYYRRIRQAEAA